MKKNHKNMWRRKRTGVRNQIKRWPLNQCVMIRLLTNEVISLILPGTLKCIHQRKIRKNEWFMYVTEACNVYLSHLKLMPVFTISFGLLHINFTKKNLVKHFPTFPAGFWIPIIFFQLDLFSLPHWGCRSLTWGYLVG